DRIALVYSAPRKTREQAVTDRYFDKLGSHFARKIYSSPKGAIRLAVLTRDLQVWIPEIGRQDSPLRVLDVGAGLGHIREWLLNRGHHLTVSEPSSEMLAAARSRRDEVPLRPRQTLSYLPLPLQELPAHTGQHDLVICHAVREWLAVPAAALVHLRQLFSPGDAVSLAFYSRDALIYKNLIKGQFRKLQRNQLAGEGKRSLTPQQPLDPRQVRQWMGEAGFDCVHQTGVRVFHDYMPEPFRSEADEQQVIEQELHYSTHPAYLHLGRYLHCWLRPRR